MNWHKVKVGDFLIRVKNIVPINDTEEYNLVTIKLYHKGVQLRKKIRGAEMRADKMSRVKAGQFILSGIDARNGAFGIIPDDLDGAVVTNDFWHFEIDTAIISNEYFLWLTSTPYFDDICNKASDGTTNRIRLQSDRFFGQELMIPEIQYQHIVVKDLKSTSNKVKQLRAEFNFQLQQIDNLNKVILQEAVQGKLVKQDKNDEHASELLKRIKRGKSNVNKKDKSLRPIKPEEIPFKIPENWVWCRLGEICSKIGSGSTPKGGNYSTSGFPFFRSQNIFDDYVSYNDIKFISSEVQKQMNGTVVVANDILLNITGGSLGRCTLIPNIFKEGNVSQHVCIIRPSYVDANFIHKIILSPYFQELIFSSTTGAGREGLPKYNLEQFLIPLPPVLEQKKIVAEINVQLDKTKRLKKIVLTNQQATQQLLTVLLNQAFEVKKTAIAKPKIKVAKSKLDKVNFDSLATSPFEQYPQDNINNIQDINWELAMMVAYIENKLGIGYGDVGLQKNVFNVSVKQAIFSKSYSFINSNFGTYSYELKDDLNKNPYLTKKIIRGKEIYTVSVTHKKQVLDKLSSPENKNFVRTFNMLLEIYEHSSINKETDKIELFNTVLKIVLDKNSKDIESIYQGMEDWKIKQDKYKTKAEKFNKKDAETMLKLLIAKKMINV